MTEDIPGILTLVSCSLLPILTVTETGTCVSGWWSSRAPKGGSGGRPGRGGRLGRGGTSTLTSTPEDNVRRMPAWEGQRAVWQGHQANRHKMSSCGKSMAGQGKPRRLQKPALWDWWE